MPDYCPNWNLIVWREVPNGIPVMTRLRCKSWQCSYCARKNREMWRSHLKKRIGRIGGQWWFITITAHENLRGRDTSLKNIRSNLDRLYKRLRRIYGKISYVRVFELHEKGAFHSHIVMRGLSHRVQKHVAKNGQEYFRATTEPKGKGNWSLRTWFRRTCRQFGMGYMVDVKALESAQTVVNYITKYMTKEAQNFNEPYLHRIQVTQDIGAANPRGDGGWHVVARVWGGDIGYQALRDANLKTVIPATYWKDNVVYPPDTLTSQDT